MRRDHPRACGEHVTLSGIERSCPGSSPRLRGTLQLGRFDEDRDRIIPALAGNTAGRNDRSCPCRDHPRACGEHFARAHPAAMFAGSSPRLRGTRLAGMTGPARAGIIPALAGNTSHRSNTTARGRDHPRACGEHYYRVPAAIAGQGSSPRLRGTRIAHPALFVWRGIIPALAGNTIPSPRCRRGNGDHPRACGEHTKKSQ